MQTQPVKVIGLMSGTSLDGIDLAYVYFTYSGSNWAYSLLHYKSISYPKAWEQKLREAVVASAEELIKLDVDYGRFLGRQLTDFIAEHNLEVDLIASHGHTVFHQPHRGFTRQIGGGQELASATGIKTITNFRAKDIVHGGQGAPLVPIGDQLLFGQYEACVNLGGIANVSFRQQGKRIAFDVGMANMVLNYLANQVGVPFDDSGKLARKGTVCAKLLEKLNKLPYYQLPYPKSTGYEWFTAEVKPLVDASQVSVNDKLATCVEHEAYQLAQVLQTAIPQSGQVLLTGGGAFNTFLVERLTHYLPAAIQLVLPAPEIINFKEAIIFGLMGVLRLQNKPNCLASVTGASKDVSGGVVYWP